MEFLGIGPLELITVLVILFLVFGPQDMVKFGATIGRMIRSLRESGTWRSIQDAQRQLKDLPDQLAKEAGLDEIGKLRGELRTELKETRGSLDQLDQQMVAWTRKPTRLSQEKKQEEGPTEQDKST